MHTIGKKVKPKLEDEADKASSRCETTTLSAVMAQKRNNHQRGDNGVTMLTN